jgi:mycothiol synthase
MLIRKATQEDFPAIAEVINRCWPDDRTTAEALEDEHSKIPEHINHDDFVAERDGTIIAHANYTHFTGMYHPQKFWSWINVMPQHRNKGVGSQLFTTSLEALQPYDPISLRTATREDQSAALHFMDKWGFTESKRYWESRLNVQTFDLTPYLNVEEKPSSHGLEITTLAELSKRDKDYEEKYYDMWCEARLDVPRPEPATDVSYENWYTWIIESPYIIPEATFIAVDKGTGNYVGVSQLLKAKDGEHLGTGLTGVRRAYRRQGIALAMKLKGISYAKQHGVPEIRTNNESTNRAMLAINEALGFIKQPVWIEFVKTSGFNPLTKEES